jgi:hypothetical protein
MVLERVNLNAQRFRSKAFPSAFPFRFVESLAFYELRRSLKGKGEEG